MNASAWLGIAQDVGVLAMFIATPWLDIPAMRRLRAHPDSTARLALYRRICLALWLGLGYVLMVAGPTRIWTIVRAPGEWPWLDSPFGAGAAISVCVGFFALAFWPGLRVLANPATRARYARGMQPLAFFLPGSARERYWWAALSISAGVCEECVFRGFLTQHLRGALDGPLQLGLTPAVLLATTAFGLNHAYQGVSGVLRTALLGLVFSLVTVLSGSLLLPIVLHALADLVALLIYRPDEHAATAARATTQTT